MSYVYPSFLYRLGSIPNDTGKTNCQAITGLMYRDKQSLTPTFRARGNLEKLNLTCMSFKCGMMHPEEATQTQGNYANTTQKGPDLARNQTQDLWPLCQCKNHEVWLFYEKRRMLFGIIQHSQVVFISWMFSLNLNLLTKLTFCQEKVAHTDDPTDGCHRFFL